LDFLKPFIPGVNKGKKEKDGSRSERLKTGEKGKWI